MSGVGHVSTVGSILCVNVELMNDDGERLTCRAWGRTVYDAVAAAEGLARSETGDESWTMNEWRAA